MKEADRVVLTVRRRFGAPAERVFDAWLDPKLAARFLFATPDGEMERVEIDPRVGGFFRIEERRGDAVAEHFGAFVEIDRPRRLVFTFATDRAAEPTRVTIEIARDGEGCELVLTHEMSPDWSDHADRARAGWTMILEGLEQAV